MPFVRAVFIIGALGLVGLPIANGFFSKDLILEGGLANGPLWAYIVMLICVGITALYSLRLVWMVFYGRQRLERTRPRRPPGHAGFLVLLAIGTLTTWLLAGGLSHMLAGSLPFHQIESETTLADGRKNTSGATHLDHPCSDRLGIRPLDRTCKIGQFGPGTQTCRCLRVGV